MLPYFQGVRDACQEQNGLPEYQIGVYGSWRVCDKITKAKLAKYAWLANATAWRGKGYKEYVARNEWALKQGVRHIDLCNLDYDPNEVGVDPIFGQFVIAP